VKDEILEELWKVKDQIASETKGSVHLLFERMREIERKSSRRKVNRTLARKEQHAQSRTSL